jgi:hypothetical protein
MKPTREQIPMMIKGIAALLWLNWLTEVRTAIYCYRSCVAFQTFAATKQKDRSKAALRSHAGAPGFTPRPHIRKPRLRNHSP